MSKCNCGAKHTSFPSQHHDWCKVIKDTSPVVLHNFARMQFKRINKDTIHVFLKETNKLLGTVDYEYWRGDFRVGIFHETYGVSETRSAILACLEYLVDCILDDRMIEWRHQTSEAKRKYRDEQSKININPHSSNRFYD